MKEQTYSPSEVCEMFNISRSTLFRWERDGYLPAVGRNEHGERVYTQRHIVTIADRKNDDFRQRLQIRGDLDDELVQGEMFEMLALRKFLSGNVLGLRELAERPELSSSTVQQLLQAAIRECDARGERFREIVSTLNSVFCE